MTIRTSISSIREAGRATQGVKLIKLDEGDEIAAITKLDEHEIEVESAEDGDATVSDITSSENTVELLQDESTPDLPADNAAKEDNAEAEDDTNDTDDNNANE